MQKITPCPCCNGFDCLNIDHNPYQTKEWNELASQARSQGESEEFHQKKTHNGFMQEYHKSRRLELLQKMKQIEIT